MEQTLSKQNNSRVSIIYKIIARVSLYLMVGLVPLTFLPWTVEQLEVNKQTLVLILVSIGVISWLGMMVTEKKFYIKKSWVFVLAFLLLVSVGISSGLSLAQFTSWVGQGKQEYTSFLSFLAFILVFVVGGHFLQETSVQRKVWTIMLLASSVVGILSIFDQFGFPLISNNLIGAPNALGLYLAISAVLASGLWLVSNDGMKNPVLPQGVWGIIAKISIFVTSLSALAVLMALDYWVLWLSLIVGLIFIFTFTILRAEEFPKTGRFVLPMILLVCGLLFIFLPSPAIGRYPVEVSPTFKTSFAIGIDSLKDTSWLFGSGPGTFVMDYIKHRPNEVNKTIFWDQNFDRSANHLLTLFATLGIVGTSLFLLMIIFIASSALKMLITERAHDEWKMTFVAFSAWSVSVFAMFVYSSNFTLSFLFWVLSAVIVSQVGNQVKQIPFSKSPRFGLLTVFLFVLVTIGLLVTMFITVSRYAGEISFAKAVASDRAGGDLDGIIVDLDNAASMNKWSDIYYRNLGNALLLRTGELLQDPSVDPELVKAYIGSSINAAERATERSPNYVLNWALYGDVLREVSPLIADADIAAIIAYEKTTELAPNNPKYLVALGRARISRSDQLNALTTSEDEAFSARMTAERDSQLELAVLDLKKAIELKPDYAQAHYQLANAYERQGNLSDAISNMEALRNAYSLDIGISLQLGLLYLRQGKTDLAQTELERTVSISPNYSNARWFLSAVYEQNKEFEKAIEQVEKIKELNPKDQAVEQRLKRLKEGQVASIIPEPLEVDDGEGVTELEGELITE